MTGRKAVLAWLIGSAVFAVAAEGDATEKGLAPFRPGVCLVLSGGGAKGFAHVGVLRALEEMGVRPSCVVGTSAGAIIGSLHCSGMRASEMEAVLKSLDFNSIIRDRPEREYLDFDQKRQPPLPSLTVEVRQGGIQLPAGLLDGQKVVQELSRLFTVMGVQDIADFDKLPVPFRAVALDLRGGEVFVFKEGRLAQAVRASMSVPFFFSPVRIGDRVLVDGGVVNNVAVDVARAMGFRKVIAVNVSKPMSPEKKKLADMFSIMDESFTQARIETDLRLLKMADLVIEPDLSDLSFTDFHRVDELVTKGYEAARASSGELAALFRGEGQPPDLMAGGASKTPGASAGVRLPGEPATSQEGQQPVEHPWKYTQPVSQIGVEGLESTRLGDVTGKLSVRVGEPPTQDDLGESVERVFALDRFRKVDYALSYKGGKLEMDFLVEEKARRELDLSLRFDSDYLFLGLGRYTSRNIMGSPSDLSVQVVAGNIQDYRVGLTVPFTFGPRLVLRPEGYFTEVPHEVQIDKKTVNTFSEKHFGLSVGSSLLVGRAFGLYGAFHVEGVRINSLGMFNTHGVHRNTFAKAGAGFDTLNDWPFPESGVRVRAEGEKGFRWFTNGLDYSKLQASAEGYLPLTSNCVVRLNGTYAYGWDLPPFSLFYAGGQSTLQWASTPLPGYSVDELLGKQVWTGGAEFRRRFPKTAVGLVDSTYLYFRYGVAGARVPVIYQDFIDLDTQMGIYHGAGVGFAAATRIGPVRVFLGFGQGGRVNWSLSIGPDF